MYFQGDNQSLIRCREDVLGCVASGAKTYFAHVYTGPATIYQPSTKATKRKMDDLLLENEEEDYFDGIKRLYNEDGTEQLPTSASSCSHELRQEYGYSSTITAHNQLAPPTHLSC